jgi:hypothetical protein
MLNEPKDNTSQESYNIQVHCIRSQYWDLGRGKAEIPQERVF